MPYDMSVIDPRVLEASPSQETPVANQVRLVRNVSVLTYTQQHVPMDDTETAHESFRIILDLRPFALNEVYQAACRVYNNNEDGSRIFLISAVQPTVSTADDPPVILTPGGLQTASSPSSLPSPETGSHHDAANLASHHVEPDILSEYGHNIFDQFIQDTDEGPSIAGFISTNSAAISPSAVTGTGVEPVDAVLPSASGIAGTSAGSNLASVSNLRSHNPALPSLTPSSNRSSELVRPNRNLGPPPSRAVTSGLPQVKPSRPSDWDPYWPEIYDLYKNKNHKLSDVIKAMTDNHNFVATRSMYKRQFKDRDCSKYKSKNNPSTNTCDRGV